MALVFITTYHPCYKYHSQCQLLFSFK